MAISSLLDFALMAVMREVHYYENTIRYLPEVLKTKMAMVLAKRGMLSERTMNLVKR